MDFQDIERFFGMSIEELVATVAETQGEDATMEEIKETIMTIFEQISSNMSQPYTLRECLSFLLKEDLIEVMKTLGFHGYSKMRKDELIEYLNEALLDSHFMETLYPSLANNEVRILEQLCNMNTPLVSTDIMYTATELIRHGICYLDAQGKHLVLPVELKEAFLAAQANKSFVQAQKHNGKIYTACSACVYFYGVYPIAGLQEHIQQLTGTYMTEQEILNWNKFSLMQREEFFFKNGYIISTSLRETPEDVVALQQLQKMKKRFFWPNTEQLVDLSMELWLISERWFEPFWSLSPFLMENEFGDIMSVSRFVEASIRTGAPFESLMGFLSEQIFAFDSMEQIDEFVQIMQNIWDNTPMWENCGYSPNQLKTAALKPTAQKNTSGKVVSLAEHRAKKNK